MQIPEKPWTGTNKSVLKDLESQESGLSSDEAKKRLFRYGQNTISHHTPIPYLQIIFDQFMDLLVLMLIFAAGLSFLLGEMRNGIVITAIVILNAVIGFTQEYKAQRIIKALNKLLPSVVKVKRNGEESQIQTNYLVPGDIVLLDQGDKVPADIRLLESYDLKADEKTLTGESHPQAKELEENVSGDLSITEVKNCLFMGTMVTKGEAMGVVVATGTKTEFGKIAIRTTHIEKTLSPLQEKTHKMSKKIAVLAVFVMIGLVAYQYFLNHQLFNALVFSVAVAASLVPEGLPATISVALSFGARYLANKNALVRNLVSVETLGSVTVICSDKTGTLTTGVMKVEEIWSDINSDINVKEKEKLIIETLALCNDAKLGKENVGDALEIALLEWLKENDKDIKEIRSRYQKTNDIPFSADRRYMALSYREGSRNFTYLKGAPEVIMDKCHLDAKDKKKICQKMDEFAKEGQRVLALAYNNIFLGLVSIFDPPREEVKEAILECERSQIKIIMVTGDNPLTASSIAKMTNITNEHESQVILGKQIDAMTDTQLRHILLGKPIFARALPEHKFRIVDNLMKMGEIVAVTGDGVNDAPALRRADIGIAMGKTGTDVSREAGDMVLLDDNFSTIVSAVRGGRTIFDNIKKFLFFIFTHNFGELSIVLLGMILGLPLPLMAVQILAIDLGTDVLPSMAMIFEPPEKDVMKTKPRSKIVQLLNGESFFHLTLLGLIIGIGAILNFTYILKTTGNYAAATTASFATLAMAQMFYVFLARTPKVSIFTYPFWRNIYLFIAVLFSLVFLYAMVYFKPMNDFFSTAPLPTSIWSHIILVGVVLLVFEEVYKLFRNRYTAN